MYVNIYVYTYICIYVYIYRHTDICIYTVSYTHTFEARRERKGEIDPDVNIMPLVPATAETPKSARRVANVGGRPMSE